MRSPLSVKRPHTNQHATNTRRNRGKLVKNARMRRKQWAHALIYSPDVAAKRKTFHVTAQAPVQKEVSEEERVRRAEKKREKKLLSKQSDEEVRRLELLRKEKEREERRLKREEEKRRQEEIEYQKWQEMQRKKEEKLQREAAEREAAEKKAAEEAKKAREAQLAAEKEKAKKAKKAAENEKKAAESEKLTKTTVSVDKTSPPEQPVAPAAKKVEEEPEKKKKKKEKEQSVEKEAPVKVSNAVETSPPLVEEEKQSKKKGGKTKKTSESDSGFHNGEHDTVLSNDVEDEKTHGKHNETHGKKNKKSKKSEGETIEVANGHITHNVFNQPDHVIDSAPLGNVPDAGFVQVDGEKKKGNKGKKHEKDAQLSMGETETTVEVDHKSTNGHHEHTQEKHETEQDELSLKKNKQKDKKGKQASPTTKEVPKVEVVTELTKDENQSAPSATKSPPIQVHEVTSTANVNGMKETSHTSSTTTSPTQFAQNVEKLISHTMHRSKAEIIEIDPNVKVTIDYQLAKLAERKTESSEPKILITPLPIELHYSRPTTPSNRERVYKLLPKDIIFCSGLLDSHGENYAAMAADPRNIYKENARAIQRKMRIFKESPHYQTYLRAKEEGKTVEEVLADEGQM
ncbi:hypothetical protein V3C99_017157 [Haemonchus contortus]|uniref:MAP7 domain-containing protein 1-like n=1 Tax=Haemonchus contortus TaxID=6289 RepID=A0A7I4Z4D7_HAECO